jgi:hypothetical protein
MPSLRRDCRKPALGWIGDLRFCPFLERSIRVTDTFAAGDPDAVYVNLANLGARYTDLSTPALLSGVFAIGVCFTPEALTEAQVSVERIEECLRVTAGRSPEFENCLRSG